MARINGLGEGIVRIFQPFFVVFVSMVLAIQLQANEPEQNQIFAHCSLVNLIATPEKYDGRRVRVEGVATIGFETNAIYLSRDSAEHGVVVNGVALALEEPARSLRETAHMKWVVVEGVFHAPGPKETGWRGYLGDITRLYDPTKVFSD